MHDERQWKEQIQVGFQVFARDGDEEFGAVRDVCPGGRDELLVYVENGGDHCLPLDAIVDVHDEKVVVDLARLPASLRGVIARAHEAELPGF